MLRRHGFAIFVFLLRQLPPAVWTVQAVTSCVQLTSCFASTETLHHEAVWLLFGAPRLWIFTSLEVQLEDGRPSVAKSFSNPPYEHGSITVFVP